MDPETKSPLEPLPKMDFKAKLMGLVDANPQIKGIPGEETDQFKIGDGDFETYEEPRQYLVMQKWRAGFDPHSESINRMAVWVRIVRLHVEWFNPEAMKRIGDLIGTTLRVDVHTAS
ncbi:hypothetical protein ACFX11_038483 [Malus domestica]